MYGQYSSQFVGRKTKRGMIEAAARRHNATIVDAVKVANNTLRYRVERNGRASGYTRFSLHDTDILTIHRDGDVIVDTGGFNTVTTRARLNKFGRQYGVRVRTLKGVLHVNGVPCHRKAWVHPDGRTVSDMPEKRID